MQFYDSVKMYVWLAVSTLLTVLAFTYAVYLDFTPPWKQYQRDFIKLQVEELEKDFAKKQAEAQSHPEAMKQELQNIMDKIKAVRHTPIRIDQIIVPELNKVDRCTTCHMGILDPRFNSAKLPLVFRTHPKLDEILGTRHPVEKFACTTCHEGQGHATTVETAHGFVHHWEHPMLEKEYIQISCGKCHNPQKPIAMAPWIQKGHDTMLAKGACLGCHKLLNEGPQKNALCPELSKEGSKRDYEYDYFNVDDKLRLDHNSVLSWHYEHFKDPSKTSPGTKMPNFGLTDEEIKALTIFVLSHKDVEKEKIPVQYLAAWDSASTAEEVPSTEGIPQKTVSKQETAVPAAPSGGGKISLDEGKKVFDSNCVACHGPQGKGDGPAGAALNPKPANFTDNVWKYGGGEDGIFKTCSKGVAGTAMPAWESQLSEDQRKSVAMYIWKTLGKH